MKRNPWPYAIIAYFAIFISGIVTWVTFAMRNDDQLVRPDYYAHEIQFQQQIDRVARTIPFGNAVDVDYDAAASQLRVRIPSSPDARHQSGSVTLYRPSDARLDKTFPLTLPSTNWQTIDVRSLQSGHWKVRLNWTVDSNEFYFEKAVALKAAAL